MSLKHQIAKYYSLLGYGDSPDSFDAPGIPQNFTCSTEVTTQGVIMNWDAPDSGGTVFYYEVFRNGSHLANVSETSYSFGSAVNGDVFKVRSVGVLGKVSAFSGTCTYTGDDELQVQGVGIPDRNSVHILWSDISGSDQISFEGYNVYLDGVKQNSSLLSSVMQGYAFFDKSAGTDYTLGVSFVHDGGQESGIFDVVVEAPGQGVRYAGMTNSRFFSIRAIVGEEAPRTRWGEPVGLAVKDGTRVTVSPDWSFLVQHREREWNYPESLSYLFKVKPLEFFGEAKVDFIEGCGTNLGLSLAYNRIDQSTITLGHTNNESADTNYVQAYITRSYDLFTMSGPPCNDPDRLVISVTFSVNETEINDVATYNEDIGYFVKLPTNDDTLKEHDNGVADNVVFVWSTFPSTPYYDIYIRTKGGSFPSTPDYEDLTAQNNMLVVENLAVDTYEAKVDYKYADKSVAGTSNILEFDIA